MKLKIILYFLISLFYITCSKPDNDPVEYKFVIINSTSKEIRLIANKRYTNEKDKITIATGDEWKKSFFSRPNDRGYFYSDALNRDSLMVIYNNQRSELFYCFRNDNDYGCDKDRNILSQFYDVDQNDRVIMNIYEFTEEDYRNAKPCTGECE